NRYYGNKLGIAPDGSERPNGIDFWWDGQGVGSCWQPASAAGSEPWVLPACGSDNMPAAFGTARYIAEPAKVLKLYVCADYDLVSQRIPYDCDWFGARGLQRIEVKYAIGEAVLLGLILLALWWRALYRSKAGFLGLLMTVGGLASGVVGTFYEGTLYTAIGLGLLGLGLFGFAIGLRRRGRPGLAFLTAAIAFFALLGAVDRGLYILPWIPVPPSLWRIILEVFWVPLALVAAASGKVMAATAATDEE